MSDKTLFLDIVTPVKKIFSGSVSSFSAPGVVGGFQTLYNHAPLLSQINIGEIKLVDELGKLFYFSTSGGFVEVNKNKIIVLAETAENALDIDLERAKKSKERAEERLKNRKSDLNILRAQISLAKALNRIKVSAKA